MKSTRRWKIAQRREAACYTGDARKPRYAPEEKQRLAASLKSREERQQQAEEVADLRATDLQRMCILEIGGRQFADLDLHGIETRHKLVLDPIPWPALSGDCQYIQAVGEFIPLKANCIHVCWTTNTIDHCADPPQVLQEIRRVLADSGRLVISCNVFAPWTRPLFPVFDRLDGPHPWHFTRSTFLAMIKRAGLSCHREFPLRKPPIRGWRRRTSVLKVLLGRMAGLSQIRLRCTPEQ